MNLTAHWKLDNPDDKSGNGLDFTDGTATFAAGKLGNAAHFDGMGSEYLYRSIIPELSLYLPWSITFWLKVNSSLSATGTILNQRDASNNRVAIQYNNVTNEVRILLYDNYLSGGVVGAASGAFGYDVWRHVTLTWNGSDTLKLYFDGVLQTGTNNAGSSSSQVLVIGARYGGYSPLDGAMDDLRIYDGVLALNQNLSIFNGGDGTELAYPWRNKYQQIYRRILAGSAA